MPLPDRIKVVCKHLEGMGWSSIPLARGQHQVAWKQGPRGARTHLLNLGLERRRGQQALCRRHLHCGFNVLLEIVSNAPPQGVIQRCINVADHGLTFVAPQWTHAKLKNGVHEGDGLQQINLTAQQRVQVAPICMGRCCVAGSKQRPQVANLQLELARAIVERRHDLL